MHIIALLLIGFSLWTAVLLIVGNILQQQGPHRRSSKVAGFMLIACLAGIQFLHLGVLLHRFDEFHSVVYPKFGSSTTKNTKCTKNFKEL